MRFPLPSAVLLETSYISRDDRLAAQIVYRAFLSAIALATAEARKGEGGLSRQAVARL